MLSQTQVSQLYVALFNRASEGSGNAFWQSFGKAADVAAERVEVANAMLGTDASQAIFPSSTTNAAFIEALYTNVFDKGGVDVDPAGKAFWVARLDAGQSRGQVVVDIIDAGLSLINSPDAATAAAAQQLQNRIDVSDFTAQTLQELPVAGNFDALLFNAAGLVVNSDPATVTAAQNTVTDIANPGNNVTLTDKADTVIGTANADVISGTVGTNATYDALSDVIIDQTSADRDVLNITGDDDAIFDAVQGIETINVSLARAGAAGFTVDVANVDGADVVNIATASTVRVGALDVAGDTNVGVFSTGTDVATTGVTVLGVDANGQTEAIAISTDSAATKIGADNVDDEGVSITTSAAVIGVTGDAAAKSSNATVSADGMTALGLDSLDSVTLSGNGSSVNYAIGIANGTTDFAVTGANAVTLTSAAASFSGRELVNSATSDVNVVVNKAGVLDLTDFDNVTNVSLAADFAANAITVNAGQDVSLNSDTAGLTINNAGKSGTLNLVIGDDGVTDITTPANDASTILASGAVALNGFSAINLSASDDAFVATSVNVGTATLAISGSANVSLGTVTASAVASASTGNITASLGADVTSFVSNAGKDVVTTTDKDTLYSVATGDNSDQITVSAAAVGSSFNTGAGNDKATLAEMTNAIVVNTAEGNDSLILTSIAADSKVDAGAGNDSVTISAPLAGVTLTGGADIDTLVVGSDVTLDAKSAVTSFETLQLDNSLTVSAAQFSALGVTTLNGVAKESLTVNADAAGGVLSLAAVTVAAGNNATTILNGGVGNDVIIGGAARDAISDDIGSDVVVGLLGDDTITLTADTTLDEVHLRSIDGSDTIAGFDALTATKDGVVNQDLIVFLDNGVTDAASGSVNFANSVDTTAGAFGTALNINDFVTVADEAAFDLLTADAKVIKLLAGMVIDGASNVTNSYVLVETAGGDTEIYYDTNYGGGADASLVATITGVGVADLDATDFAVYTTV